MDYLNLKKKVLGLVKAKRFGEAISLAKNAADKNPFEDSMWGLLSHAYGINGDFEKAILAANQAIQLNSNEPAHRFQRGRLSLQIDKADNALVDMEHVLSLGKSCRNAYYAQSAILFQAEALFRLQRYDDAAKVCERAGDDACIFAGKFLTKKDLMDACLKKLNPGPMLR
ncbi:MAG: hypothetical protein NTY60_02515 [Proteobacteria bacterium]|nr:hypothetical protein [Pseudomonadota bacterium]